MLELNGFKYSRESFEDYEVRIKVKFVSIDGTTILDVFTTDTDRERLEEVLIERKADKVISLNIIHWATREQDDIASKFIDEWLNLTD